MKKNIELVKEESAKLYQEIIDNGYSEEIAKMISDDLSQKGGYLFNKSHSFSYAVICFQTAFLKTYYPMYFFKALFNLNKDKAGMLNKYILDAKQFEVKVLPPNINKSQMNFSINNEAILFGLSAIKGIGENFATEILNNRNCNFASMQDFIERVNPKKTQIISLIKSGAIPCKDKKKALMKYLMSTYTKSNFKPVTSVPSPYSKLEAFGLNVDDYREGKKVDKERLLSDYNKVRLQNFEINEQEKLKAFQSECFDKYLRNEEFWEFESLQIFLNNNPFDKAYEYLEPFSEVEIGNKCTIVGIVAKVQKKKDKNKKQFAFMNIYSSFGLIECIVWHSKLKEYEDMVKTGQQLALLVKKDNEDRVVLEKLKPYEVWLQQTKQKGVLI